MDHDAYTCAFMDNSTDDYVNDSADADDYVDDYEDAVADAPLYLMFLSQLHRGEPIILIYPYS